MLIERLHNSKYAEENGFWQRQGPPWETNTPLCCPMQMLMLMIAIVGHNQITIVAQGALEICDAAHCLEVMKKK